MRPSPDSIYREAPPDDRPRAPLPRDPHPFSRTLLIALAAPAISVVACAVVGTSISGVLATFLAVILGIASIVVLGDDRAGAVALVGMIFIVAGASIVALVTCPIRLAGTPVAELDLREAPRAPLPVGFRFPDAHVESRFEASAPVRGKHSVLYTQYVAPVVPAGWTPADPVPAWAANEPHDLAAAEAEWKEPDRAGARLVRGMLKSEYDDAIARAAERHHLRSAPDAPVLLWCRDPIAEWMGAWRRVGLIALFASLFSLLAVAIDRARGGVGSPAAKRRSRSVRGA